MSVLNKNQSSSKQPCWLIIPAAGVGQRVGSDIPKQYIKLNDKTIIERTLSIFINYARIKKIVVVLNQHDTIWSELTIANHPLILTTEGGDTRAHSVLNGLMMLRSQAQQDDWVMVHDAVRPYIKVELIDRLLSTINHHPVGGLLGMPVHDTLKQVNQQQQVEKTMMRDNIWQAQTPQCFRFNHLLQALQTCLAKNIAITDESSAIEYLGLRPLMIKGHIDNVKITTTDDLAHHTQRG